MGCDIVDVRKLLGREKADRVILESHFQLDGFYHVRARRHGRSLMRIDIWRVGGTYKHMARIFRQRKIGPL